MSEILIVREIIQEQGVFGNSGLSTLFCCDSKTALENEVYLKKKKSDRSVRFEETPYSILEKTTASYTHIHIGTQISLIIISTFHAKLSLHQDTKFL